MLLGTFLERYCGTTEKTTPSKKLADTSILFLGLEIHLKAGISGKSDILLYLPTLVCPDQSRQ